MSDALTPGLIEHKQCSTCGEYSTATRHIRTEKYDYWVMEGCLHTYYTWRSNAPVEKPNE